MSTSKTQKASARHQAPKKSRKRKSESEAQELDTLFEQLEDGLVALDQAIEDTRGQKEAMFDQFTLEAQQHDNADYTAAFEGALNGKRESHLSHLKRDMKAIFDRLEPDVAEYFKLKTMFGRNQIRIVKRFANSSIAAYVQEKGAKFLPSSDPARTSFGSLKWTSDHTSLQCIKWCNDGLVTRDSFRPKTSFTFNGRSVSVRHVPDKTSRVIKHNYLFDKLGKENQVLASVPFELGYDIFNFPTAFYTHGSRLLLVTSFYSLPTNLIFNMLKKLDVNRELPETKPAKNYNACYLALFDANFKLVKELVTSERLDVGRYSFAVDLINERGIMLSKSFTSVRSSDNATGFATAYKRLVTFYDYSFKPIFKDLQLPESNSSTNFVKIDKNLISCVGLHSKKEIKLTVYDLDAQSVVSSKILPRGDRRHTSPVKYLLDSRNNLYTVYRSYFNFLAFSGTHGYFITCINLDSLDMTEIDPWSDSAFHRACYLTESDKLVIVSNPEASRELVYATFAF